MIAGNPHINEQKGWERGDTISEAAAAATVPESISKLQATKAERKREKKKIIGGVTGGRGGGRRSGCWEGERGALVSKVQPPDGREGGGGVREVPLGDSPPPFVP